MLIYNISIRFYSFLITLFSFFNPKAKLFIKGRKNIWKNLKSIDNKNIIWIHCASLGEFDQGIPLMNLLKKRDLSCKILVTFFSPSGMENYNKRNHCADYVFYLPIDTPQNAKKFIKTINPKKIFFVKYEFWLNYIFIAKNLHIPLYSISCILRPNQHFFKPFGVNFRKALKCFNLFFVQNEETKNLLNKIGIKKVIITGDTRYDKVIENKENLSKDNIIESFLNNSKAIILGSSWQYEESILYAVLNTNQIKDKIIIAPHDISEKHLLQIESLFLNRIIRYSKFNLYSNEQILLIDSIGKLSNAYQYGKFALVGGGFTGNLHNTLEPIVFGLPTVFGPKHTKFPEADFFIKEGVAKNISNEFELCIAFSFYENRLEDVKRKCEKIIETSKGASQKIINEIYN